MRLTKLLLGCMVSTCMSLMTGSPADARPTVPPSVHKPATPPPTTPSMQHGSRKPTTPPPVKGPTAPLNPIAAKIASKPQLNAKVTALLPSGMLLNDASNGFKNQGQFLAALHVSRNLGIPFSSLKQDMTGRKLSLGQSIQDLKKSADAEHETERAEREANDDLEKTSGRKP